MSKNKYKDPELNKIDSILKNNRCGKITYYCFYKKNENRKIYFHLENDFVFKFFGKKLCKISYLLFIKFLYFLYIVKKYLKINFFFLLKKEKLPDYFGNLVLFGEKIVIFNRENKLIYLVNRYKNYKKNFLISKIYQKKKIFEDFFPKVIELNKKNYYSIEEYIENNDKNYEKLSFLKLLEFYKLNKERKINLENYKNSILNELKNKNLHYKNLKKIMLKIDNNKKIFSIISHGDFSSHNIIKNKKVIKFVDIQPIREAYLFDFFAFFNNFNLRRRKNQNIIKNILSLYPQKIRENSIDYMILSEIRLLLRHKSSEEYFLKRINLWKKILN